MLYDVNVNGEHPQGRRELLAQRLLLHARPHQRSVPARRPVPGEDHLDEGHRPEDRQAGRLRSDQGRPALCRHRRDAREARPGGLPVVERLADLLPADARRQAHGRLCGRRRGLHLLDRRQVADGREEGLCRPAALLHRAGPRHRPRRAVGDGPQDRQDRRQGDVPAADRVRHALDRRRPAVHRPHERQARRL